MSYDFARYVASEITDLSTAHQPPSEEVEAHESFIQAELPIVAVCYLIPALSSAVFSLNVEINVKMKCRCWTLIWVALCSNPYTNSLCRSICKSEFFCALIFVRKVDLGKHPVRLL
jgi:hypothetical protein